MIDASMILAGGGILIFGIIVKRFLDKKEIKKQRIAKSQKKKTESEELNRMEYKYGNRRVVIRNQTEDIKQKIEVLNDKMSVIKDSK